MGDGHLQLFSYFMLVQRVFDRVTEFILFKYILEMRAVRLKLESTSVDEYQASLKV